MVEIKYWNKEKFVIFREILNWKLVNEEEIFPAKGDESRRIGEIKRTEINHKLV